MFNNAYFNQQCYEKKSRKGPFITTQPLTDAGNIENPQLLINTLFFQFRIVVWPRSL